MRVRSDRQYKLMTAIVAGILTWIVATVADLALVPLDRSFLTRRIVANFIPGLMAVVVTLAIQLRHEEVHNTVAMQRAAVVAELNHHVRNAVFPLVIAVHRLGDDDTKRTAEDAVERINLALKDATADAYSRRVEYAASDESRQAA